MSTQDQELFDLCKQVYEATGWIDEDFKFWLKYFYGADRSEYKLERVMDLQDVGKYDVPLYTSDYLLEKLPSWYFDTDIEETMILALMPHMLETGKWIGRYETPEHRGSEFETIADTPLKSLLKLTLALKKEGLLS